MKKNKIIVLCTCVALILYSIVLPVKAVAADIGSICHEAQTIRKNYHTSGRDLVKKIQKNQSIMSKIRDGLCKQNTCRM